MREGTLLWEPSPTVRDNARISRFLTWLRESQGLAFGSYDELWRWSVTKTNDFWSAVWSYFGLPAEPRRGRVRDGSMPDVRWFPDARLNYARHALDRKDDQPALLFRTEWGSARTITFSELSHEVARVTIGLRSLGVCRGDRVVAYAPNIPETLIAFLATASIGAIWSSCSPDFGVRSVVDRFAQVEPKVLLAVDGYAYAGRPHDRRDVVRDIVAELGSLETLVQLPYLRPASEAVSGVNQRVVSWSELRRDDGPLEFAEVPFNHPLWVLYSSGTTGLPKAIVHGHGGVLLEHLKTLALHTDLGPGDTFFWHTTTGWMMWNFLIGGLLVGATVVLYDGSPGHPDLDALWRMAEETGITYFGTSAPYLAACAKAGLEPGARFDLRRIKGIGSTGSPLAPEEFAWVYKHVSDDLLLGSFSGGTDLCTGFVGPCPLLPVRAGVIQCRCLGASVEAFDQDGRSVVDEVGELVLTEPMPSMPIFFWNDPEGHRYRKSYFDMYPGVWRHGDWIKLLPDEGCVIYGRSDSTLNRGGVRMGTSEFYQVVERFPEIVDSLVVDTGGLGREGRLVLFVTLEHNYAQGDLFARIRSALRKELSPRHVPDEIYQVPGVPRTLSGKKLEVPVRKILQGTPVEQVASPDATNDPELLYAIARTFQDHEGGPAGLPRKQ